MIGIVVVSHSRALADAAVALASEMSDGDSGGGPVIEVAAGLDEQTFGTDAMAVSEAIGRADAGDGVLVLLDLGSAVLSAEMALEFLDPDLAARVRLTSAPLVEGLIAASVAAGAGADLATAAREAERGLLAKAQHLGPPGDAPATSSGVDARHAQGRASVTRELQVTAPHGLHARPAAQFVRAVGAVPGVRVEVRNLDSGRGPVDGRSLTGIATLDARQGHRIEVSAAGDRAGELLDALSALAETGFGDLRLPTTATRAGATDGTRSGTGTRGGTVARGRTRPTDGTPEGGPTFGLDAALGPVYRIDVPVDEGSYAPGDASQEADAFDRAVQQARGELTDLISRTRDEVGDEQAAVFDAHLAILEDPDFQDPVRGDIRDGASAPQAVAARVPVLRARFEGLSDDYQRARGADVSSVGTRLLRALRGELHAEPAGTGILVVQELDPATAVQLNSRETLGVITLRGGATGHGVLLARARGLPVLTAAGAVADVPGGTLVAFDARSGRLEIDPDAPTRAEFEALLTERARARQRMTDHADDPAVTLDGHHVAVKANLASITEARIAADSGADGSGLVRTEALFGDRVVAPSVAEQVAAFEQIAESLPGRTITIRTWDVGGDKPLPFHPQELEANPFLGVRGIRAFRRDPRLLVDQLEAVCRVARDHPVRVMFPMVTTVEEVDWALALLDEAAGRLPDGRPDALEVGIMVEVPAAALRAEALSTLLDFVSIGSNDLTQYVLAAERGSAPLAALADAADPAVLQLIRDTVTGVADGVEVCLCGDAASDPALALLLVGLGVGELSATPVSVPAVKDAVRHERLADLQDLAARALKLESAGEVRELLAALAVRH